MDPDGKKLASLGLTSFGLLLPVIILAGAALRFIGLGNYSMWCDELYTVWVTRLPSGSFSTALAAWGHPPLYYLIGKVWFAFSSSDAWSRSLSFASGVAIIFLVFLLGKELFSRQVGLWAALLAALSPILVSYSRDATVYSWLTAVTLLSFYLLTRSMSKGGWRNWTLFTIVATITMFTHLFAFVLLPAFAGVYFILRDREKGPFRPFAASMLTLAVAFAVSWQISSRANGLIDVKFPMKIILLKLVLIPYVLLEGGFNDFGDGLGGFITQYGPDRPLYLATILFILLAIPLAVVFWRSRALRRAVLSRNAIALVFFVVTVSVIPLLLHNMLDIPDQPSQRFYLWATPVFLLLVAVGIAALSKWGKVIAATVLIAGFAAMNIYGIFFYRPVDFRTPLNFVSGNYQSGDLLISPLYDITVLAEGHYLPASLPTVSLFVPADGKGPGEYYYMPTAGDVFDYTVGNYKTIDPKYLSAGEDLKVKTEHSVDGADRVWLVVFKGDDGSEYCPGCDILGSALAGWQTQSWSFDSGEVYLYTRTTAA